MLKLKRRHRMNEFREVPVWFNKPQKRSMLVNAHTEYGVWGRGTGKTQGPIASRSAHGANVMPRGATGVVCATYMQAIDRTLPPLIKSWGRLGYIENVHFWVRKAPPPKLDIPSAIYKVMNYEHSITWWNGHVFHIISQDRPGLANSKSLDALIGDEARFLNFDRYQQDVIPANRGNDEIFSHLSEHHMVTLFTDQPLNSKGNWIFDKKELMDPKKINQIANLQFELYKIIDKAKSAKTPQSLAYYKRKILEYERVLAVIRRDTIYYSEASSLDNIQILGEEQIRQWRRELTWPIFQASILNERVITVENGFYHLLDVDFHCYQNEFDYSYIDSLGIKPENGSLKDCRKDADIVKGMPLDISMDYNSKIKSLVVGQETRHFYRILKSMYALRSDAKVLDDLVDDFCEYYKHHNPHTVKFYYDNTAKVTDATRLHSLADAVIDRFRKNGWFVIPVYIGQQPKHETRYRMWETVLKESDDRFKKVRFNKEGCEALLVSMQQTKTRQGKNGFEKDKRSELNSSIKPQDAPHLGDALDTLYIGKFKTEYGYSNPVGDLLILG